MVKASLRESTPLLYGTGVAQVQESVARSAASRSQARSWKIAVASAALLCASALVSTKWNASSLVSLDHVMSSSQVSLSKESTEAGTDVKDTDLSTADFFKTLELFKNPNADPCVDFYEYACGGWLAQNEIPTDRPEINSAFYAVGEENKKIIAKIIDSKPPVISEFYTSCLNIEEVNNEAVAYVAKIIDSIHQVNTTVGLLSYAGELDQSYGISSFVSVGVGADPEDPSTNLLQLAQGGLTLPSREYYLEAAKKDAYSALFAKYVADLFAVDGLEKHNVTEYASAVFETETKFAEISLTNAELRDPWTTNDAFTFTSIEAKYPFLAAYLDGVNKQEPFPKTHAIIATPAFFAAQNDIFQSIDVQTLKQYLSFHVIDSFGSILGEYFRRISHDFHGAVNGAGSLSTREKYCVDTTTSYLGAFLGEYYMEEVFGPDAKNSAKELVQEIESSMKKLLKTEEWLDKITYEAAVAKLEQVKNYIGGPDEVPDLPFQLSADNFFDNVVSLLQLSASETIQSIGEPVDATKWDMFASTVNAYYDPSANKMVFPAAILQPPFYSADRYPAAANYARIGMVMGHELSHGFDDQGRNYDGNGTLRKWWTTSVSDDFTSRAQCLSAQYSSFPVVTEDGVLLGNVNGDLTLGENIADNGGIHLAYQAYKLSQQDESSTVVAPKPKGEDKANDGGDKKKGEDVKKDDEGEEVKKSKKDGDDEKEADDDKKSKKEDDKKEDEDDDKKSKKSKKDDDKKEKDDDKSKRKKSKKEDEDDDKKSKKSKKDDDKKEKDDDKESKHKKSKKDDEKDDEDDDKKSKHHKSKEDDEDGKKSKHKKSKKDDEDDEDDKKSKHHKKSKDDDADDRKSKHHKSKKHDDYDEDDKKSKHHKSKKDENEDDKESHHKKSKNGDNDDEEEDSDKKSKKHLRRVFAFEPLQMAKKNSIKAAAADGSELSAEIEDDRLFFTAFAQNWCEKRAPAYAELLRAIDPHSPGRWRVNGPLKNFDKFAAAFQCKLGTPMNPEKKCLVW
ncbi:Neprilysin cd10, peptidase, partial [Globisporangium splendens]